MARFNVADLGRKEASPPTPPRDRETSMAYAPPSPAWNRTRACLSPSAFLLYVDSPRISGRWHACSDNVSGAQRPAAVRSVGASRAAATGTLSRLRRHHHGLPCDRASWILVLVVVLRRQNVSMCDRNLMAASSASIDARIRRRRSRVPLEVEVPAIVYLQKSDVLVVRHNFSTLVPEAPRALWAA